MKNEYITKHNERIHEDIAYLFQEIITYFKEGGKKIFTSAKKRKKNRQEKEKKFPSESRRFEQVLNHFNLILIDIFAIKYRNGRVFITLPCIYNPSFFEIF